MMSHLCESRDVGDEYHYVMSCNSLNQERKRLLPYYCTLRPNIYKYQQLMSSNNYIVLEKLCRFIKNINVRVTPPG